MDFAILYKHRRERDAAKEKAASLYRRIRVSIRRKLERVKGIEPSS